MLISRLLVDMLTSLCHMPLHVVSLTALSNCRAPGVAQQGVPTRDIAEDEDLLNVALWTEGATKAWCASDQGFWGLSKQILHGFSLIFDGFSWI